MIQVWICDDNKKMAVLIARFVNRTFGIMNRGVVLDTYFSGGEVIDNLNKDKVVPDIILLAVKMKYIQGCEVAEELKRLHCHTLLIFVSAYSSLFFGVLKYSPIGCVVKNCMNTEIEYYLMKALILLEYLGEALLLSVDGRKVQIHLHEISYFNCENKKVIINLVNGERLSVRKSLKKIYEEQKSDDLIFISRSVLINQNYVRGFCKGEVLMVKGVSLLCSMKNKW